MHVSWQRKVVNVLKETFPNIQFIITTHSPQVLGEINSDFNVFSLRKEEDDIVCEKFQNYFGLDTNSILEEAFHTSSLNEIYGYNDPSRQHFPPCMKQTNWYTPTEHLYRSHIPAQIKFLNPDVLA